MSERIRVYLPATVAGLAVLHRDGALVATEAYAVTATLREQLSVNDAGSARELRGTDDEELSYAAYRLAADASLRLLRADPAAPRRRVVVSADVPAQPAAGGDAGAVRLAGPVPISAVGAIHIDGVAAEPAVAAALDAAGEGADDASVEDELEWYDVSELAQLLA